MAAANRVVNAYQNTRHVSNPAGTTPKGSCITRIAEIN